MLTNRFLPSCLILACCLLLAPSPAGALLAHNREEILIPMPDTHPDLGEQVRLSADRYLPETGSGPWPVVLLQTPYFKELTVQNYRNKRPDDPLFLSQDYAFVVMDWRGYGASRSKDMAYLGAPSMGEDGYQAVEWIAAQSAWCDGRVGTFGSSALGLVQMKTAAEAPPHLYCCMPQVNHFREWYDLAYPGGVYARNLKGFIGSFFGGGLTEEHPLKDGLWDLVEATSGDPAAIEVPMLFVSGWYDHETLQTIREFRALQSEGGTGARGRQKMLIGPWSHSAVGLENQLELDYPAARYESSLEALRFFDHYLRDIDNDWPERPPLRLFQTNEDRWLDDQDWPPAETSTRTLYLTGPGALTPQMPDEAATLSYHADPLDPVPSVCGALLNSSFGEQGPADLRALENRPDLLVFRTETLTSPLRLAGNPEARLWISCDAPDTDLNLRLVQYWPDGRAMWIADGVRRASLRNGYRHKEPLSPGQVYAVPVQFPPLCLTVPAGHRLGLYLLPSNYDRFDVNMQDGSDLSDQDGATARSADVTLYMDAAQPSHLILPLRPNESPSASRVWATYH